MLTNASVSPVLPASDLARAKEFYQKKLGLKLLSESMPGTVLFEAGHGTRMEIYEHGAPKAENTAASFAVEDIAAAVRELKGNGIIFEEYDFPDFKTVESIATMGTMKAAWFKDTEGNILCLHEGG